MKKIINKIKQNENLCKVLKVLKLVLDLVVYGFAIFMLIGLAIGSTYKLKESQAQEKQLIPNVATTPIKNEIQERYIVWYGIGDLMSPAFAQTTYDMLTDSSISQIGLSGKNYSNFLNGETININTQDMVWGDLNTTGDSIDNNNNFVFENLNIKKYNNLSYPRYRISFTRVLNSGRLSFDFYYSRYSIYNSSNELTYQNWSSSVAINISNNGGSSWSDFAMSANYSGSYVGFPKNENFNWLGTESNLLNEYYNNGYNAGYQNGKDVGQANGYEEGHNVGYYEGLQAAEEGETTMFSLITRAFNAIASILDIQVLPNLSLGLLIFTPIIVSIIILIIKMVKG